MIALSTDIPHPRGHLTYPLKMHPHLRNPSEPQHRRRLADNASTVLSSFRIPLPRHLHEEHGQRRHPERAPHPTGRRRPPDPHRRTDLDVRYEPRGYVARRAQRLADPNGARSQRHP